MRKKMFQKKRKSSKTNYILRIERKTEQEYQNFQEDMQGWKQKNTKDNLKISIGIIFILLYFITAIFIVKLVFKDTTMPLIIYCDIPPLIFFLCMLIGWILLAGVFCFFYYPRIGHKRLQRKARAFVVIANIIMYSMWLEVIVFSPIINMWHRFTLAMAILIITFLVSCYLLHKIWRCPSCHTALPISKPGYRVLIGAPIDCIVCPHCEKTIE